MQVQSAAVKRQSEADKRPDKSVLFLFGVFFSTSLLMFMLPSSGTSAVDFFFYIRDQVCVDQCKKPPLDLYCLTRATHYVE